jgi:hypothetical protein
MENSTLEWLSIRGVDLRTFDRYGNGLTSRDVIHKRKEKPRQQFPKYKSKPKKKTKARHTELTKEGIKIEYLENNGRYYSKGEKKLYYSPSINGKDALKDFKEYLENTKTYRKRITK